MVEEEIKDLDKNNTFSKIGKNIFNRLSIELWLRRVMLYESIGWVSLASSYCIEKESPLSEPQSETHFILTKLLCTLTRTFSYKIYTRR